MALTIQPEPQRYKGFQPPVQEGYVYNYIHDELMAI